MPYSKPFYIEGEMGNNEFSFTQRRNFHNPKIYVPSLIRGNQEDIKRGKEIAFEEFVDGEVKSFKGLENFVKLKNPFNNSDIVVIDNHNHAFYFWLEFLHKINFQQIILIHIDEHTDMREPDLYFNKENINKNEKIFQYTNNVLNVGNFIKPFLKLNLCEDIIMIRSEKDFEKLDNLKKTIPIILDIDMDIFSERVGIDEKFLIQKIRSLIEISDFVNISTSPYFIDQEKAINLCKNLLNHFFDTSAISSS